MPRTSFVGFALVLSLAVAALAEERPDGVAIQGTWKLAAAELAGSPFPDEIRKTITLVMTDGAYIVSVGSAVDKGTVKLNPSAKPKELNVTGTEGPNAGRTFYGIYELQGDTLRICYDLSGKGRPTEFKTTAGTQLFLVTYARAAT